MEQVIWQEILSSKIIRLEIMLTQITRLVFMEGLRKLAR